MTSTPADRPQPGGDRAAAGRPAVSVVMAAHNEERTLGPVFERAVRVLEDVAGDWEILILDDGSTDGTWQVAQRLQAARPDRVRLLRHARNQGIAATFEDLYRAAEKDYVFDVPADGEYPPETLRRIVPLVDRYDIVICRRRRKNYTCYRHLVSACYRLLPRLLFGVELYDPGSVKLRRRDVLRQVPVASRGVFVEAERLIRSARRGWRIGVVDMEPELRRGGKPRGARLANVLGAVRDLAALWVRLVVLRQAP